MGEKTYTESEFNDALDMARENAFEAGQLEPDFGRLDLSSVCPDWLNTASVDQIKAFVRDLYPSTLVHLRAALEARNE